VTRDDDVDNNNNNNNNKIIIIIIINSTIKLAAKIIEELNRLNGKNDAKQDEIQHKNARLGEVLKKK
jgi:hypothetical protein